MPAAKGLPRKVPPLDGRRPLNNCGQPSHQSECICDVIVTDADRARPYRYGTHDLWHGDAIARAIGVGVPWKPEDFALFGESLLKAYDIWSREERRGEPLEQEVLRMKVIDLLRTGESMNDVGLLLNIERDDIMRAMTNNTPATVWGWTETDWRHAEAIIYDHFANHGCEKLIEMLGGDMHHCVVEQLADWYGVKINENGQDRLDRLKRLLIDGMHPIDAVVAAADMGYVVSDQQLYHMRKRLAQRGEVSDVLPRRLAKAS